MSTEPTEPNFTIRQNVCPKCGHYIWAHPVQDVCHLSAGDALLAYSLQVQVNREYVRKNEQTSTVV